MAIKVTTTLCEGADCGNRVQIDSRNVDFIDGEVRFDITLYKIALRGLITSDSKCGKINSKTTFIVLFFDMDSQPIKTLAFDRMDDYYVYFC